MNSRMSEALWYPADDDVLAIHESIVAEYSKTEPKRIAGSPWFSIVKYSYE